MTESEAMKSMENAIAEITKTNTLKMQPAPTGLDATRLLELARERLTFARQVLKDLQREHRLKLTEIIGIHAERIEQAGNERDEAIIALERAIEARAKPARDMITVVERMLG